VPSESWHGAWAALGSQHFSSRDPSHNDPSHDHHEHDPNLNHHAQLKARLYHILNTPGRLDQLLTVSGGYGGHNDTKEEGKEETSHDTHRAAVRQPAVREEILSPLLPYPPPQLKRKPDCWRLCDRRWVSECVRVRAPGPVSRVGAAQTVTPRPPPPPAPGGGGGGAAPRPRRQPG